ncbi:MAG: hypothetical protein Q8P23_00555 [bacterium]|nr:hypothetical protein [bacterium]
MANAVTLPGERLAGLQVDLLQKFRNGVRTLDELDMFLQGKNPFAFERNEHGHTVFTFTGLNLTGAQEIERLEGEGFRFGKYAKQCLTSTKSDSYDAKHRLVAGQTYKITLMPTKEIEVDSERTTANLRKRGMEEYGYGKPLAGIVPRYREKISDKQMEEMGFWYIASLHEPINDSGGDSRVLDTDRYGDGSWVSTGWVRPDGHWSDGGAFAFLVPAS